MEVAKRDLMIEQMRKELQYRKDLMLGKAQELSKAQVDNEYLVGVADDYKRYYTTIKSEREQQMAALMQISEYISQYSRDLQETDSLLDESKMQQQEIVKEIDRIKTALDEML